MILYTVQYTVIAVLVILGSVACNRSAVQAPALLPVEQLDTTLQQAFANADQEIKTEASQYVTFMQNHDWPGAITQLKELRSHSELTQAQRATLARVHQTTVRQLNDSAEKGDEDAAAVMSAYKASK